MEHAYFSTKMLTDDAGTITGMAWPFAAPDRVGDWIEKGAFSKANLPLPMLFAHDQKDPIGAWTEAKETDEGLEITGKMLVGEMNRAREVSALVKSGAIRGLSIGFFTKKSKPRAGGGRTITDLELIEASLVSVPMHPNAQIRSAKSGIEALQLAEAINRATAQFAAR
ncbi:peptidase U35 [Ahrensia marina]|uniref:Peptidase U35 n=2 Tax=Ahrensia marina TaxID=1514904 RepID=A0A0M9GKP5_9HYPH|nr:HK97 family phage prohead protease [Ahrensia marina]KPA99982.1 peptidase U35 [Ahrensia marina]